jgi:hypothetical protein
VTTLFIRRMNVETNDIYILPNYNALFESAALIIFILQFLKVNILILHYAMLTFISSERNQPVLNYDGYHYTLQI